MRKLFLISVLLLVACKSPQELYVQADRATYDYMSTEGLDSGNAPITSAVLASWELRIKKAEEKFK